MARSGITLGTVIRWDDASPSGLVEAPDLPQNCGVNASVIDHGSVGGDRRAGQVVEVHWTGTDRDEHPVRATRVVHREDLQTGLGG